MDKPRIVGNTKPRIVSQPETQTPPNPQQNIQQKIQAQATKDIAPVSGETLPFELNSDLKEKIDEDQKKRKQGIFNRIKTILKIQ